MFVATRHGRFTMSRLLHTILEKVVEDVNDVGPDLSRKRVTIGGPFVRDKLVAIIQCEHLSKFIL